MKKTLLLILAVVAMAMSAVAQNPVRWRTVVKMTSPTEGEIVIKALVDNGWHLYGLDMPDGGPKATRFDFSASTGIKTVGDIRPSSEPVAKMDPLFGQKLSWWDSNVNFTQRFKVTDKSKGAIKVAITFMSCNGETCTPPRTETVTANIPQYDSSKQTPSKK